MNKKIIGGYCGFYKGNFLRSSYEYVYCRILEKENITYKVEEKSYNLTSGRYTPDFHIYNENNKLVKIVEIKSSRRKEIIKAIERSKEIKKLLKIDFEILQYNDLKKLCKKLKMDFKELSDYWKSIANGKNIARGNLNPMYGRNHTNNTLKKIGESSKNRWKDKEFRKKMSNKRKEYFKNDKNRKNISTKQLNRHKRNRKLNNIPEYTDLKCKQCKTIISIRFDDRRKKFCSQPCANKYITKLANKSVRAKNKKFHSEIIKDLYKEFSKNENYELLLSKKRNLIYKKVKEVLEIHGLKDIRNFKFLITGNYNGSFTEIHNKFFTDLNIYLKSMPNLQNGKL